MCYRCVRGLLNTRAQRAWQNQAPPHSQEAGFTLVELLIALVILSVITLLLFSGLRLGSRAWESVETFSERTADLRLARNFIERSLREAASISLRFDGRERLVFTGEPNRLEFVAPLPVHVGVPGLYVLRLTLEDADGDHQSLVLTRWLLHPDVLSGEFEAPAWEPLVDASRFGINSQERDQDLAGSAFGRTLLIPAVGTFSLSYFGLARGDTTADWREDWIDQDVLPSRVRIDLTTSEQSWPAALVALPAGGVLPQLL